MKPNWQTTLPTVSGTGKSKLLLCKAIWENEEYPVLAFYNENTKEWIEANLKPVKGEVTKWCEID